MLRVALLSGAAHWARGISAAFVSGSLIAGCGVQAHNSAAILDGLHACPSAGQVVGAVVGVSKTESQEDGPGVDAFNTWLLNLDGSAKQVTQDGHHFGAIISPDARSVFQLRSSGRLMGDAPELPNIIEELFVETGDVREVASLDGIYDLSISDDGRTLAAAHSSVDESSPGAIINSVTLVDLETNNVGKTMPRAPDVPQDVFSSVNQIALSPDGRLLAYSLAVEVELYKNITTLRVRNLATNADSILYTAKGADFITDLAWSADGDRILAIEKYLRADDTVESPARYRNVQVAVAEGQTSIADSYAPVISPITRDGTGLLGVMRKQPDEKEARPYAFVAWNDKSRMVEELPFDGAASSVSIASCSYS